MGTKFGCGIAQCGACTVHLDGQPVRPYVLPGGALSNYGIKDFVNIKSVYVA